MDVTMTTLNRLVLFSVFLTIIFITKDAFAYIQVIPQSVPYGRAASSFGQGLADGIAIGMEQQRQLRIEQNRFRIEQNRLLEKKQDREMEQYNETVRLLSLSEKHPDLKIPDELSECVITNGGRAYGRRRLSYRLKTKFTRVIGDGAMAEWSWSLEFFNQTRRKVRSARRINLEKAKIEIQILDKDGMSLSKCVLYSDIYLKHGEKTTLQGRWFIPFTQLDKVSKYNVKID